MLTSRLMPRTKVRSGSFSLPFLPLTGDFSISATHNTGFRVLRTQKLANSFSSAYSTVFLCLTISSISRFTRSSIFLWPVYCGLFFITFIGGRSDARSERIH